MNIIKSEGEVYMSKFNFSEFYKVVLKDRKNVTQKEAGYILFTGARSEGSSDYIQESTISTYMNGKRPISNALRDEIIHSDDVIR